MEVLKSDIFGVGGGQASSLHGPQSRSKHRIADLRSPLTYSKRLAAIAAMRPTYNDLGTNGTGGPGQMATDRVRRESSEPDNNSQLSGMAVLILPRTLVAAVRRQHGSRAVSTQPLPSPISPMVVIPSEAKMLE